MTDMQADPMRTFALVVGIERYDTNENWDSKTDESWDLIGPAQDARRFVEWLRSRGVPDENISLFLAPLDGGLRRHGTLQEQPATSDLIRHAITKTLPAKQGDLLYVFWSGRSVRTTEGTHRLLYADATEQSRQNLNPDTLLSMLRSSTFAQLPRQICIIDTYTHTTKKRNSLAIAPATMLAHGQNMPSIQQFVLFAASHPTTSMSSPRLFSKEVLQYLTGAQTSLLPDMDALARQLHERFKELRKNRATARIPNYNYTDWDGKLHKHTYVTKRGRQGQNRIGQSNIIELCLSESGEEVGTGFYQDNVTNWETLRLNRDLFSSPSSYDSLDQWITTALTLLSKKDSSIRHITPNERVQKIGKILFGDLGLANGPLLEEYQQKSDQLPIDKPLQLRLSVPAKLSSVPWELLWDGEYWLARDKGRTFARLPQPTAQTKSTFLNNTYELHKRKNPLYIVVVAASHTSDQTEECGNHVNMLRRCFECVSDERVLKFQFIQGLETYQELLARLDKDEPIHVLHIFARGEMPRDDYKLLLTGSKAAVNSSSRAKSKKGAFEGAGLRGSDLRNAVRKRHAAHPNQLQLVVLNADYSAREPQNSQLRSLAAGIVLDGVPAVVAVQGKLKPDVLTLAMPEFYEAILDAEPIDAALNRARSKIPDSSLDWANLVLFVHPGTLDLHLFESRIPRNKQQSEITREEFLEAQDVRCNMSNRDFLANRSGGLASDFPEIFVPGPLREPKTKQLFNLPIGTAMPDIKDTSPVKHLKPLSELKSFFFFAEPGHGISSYQLRIAEDSPKSAIIVNINYNGAWPRSPQDYEQAHFAILRRNIYAELRQLLHDKEKRNYIEHNYPDQWAFYRQLQSEFIPPIKNKLTIPIVFVYWIKDLIEFIKIADLQSIHLFISDLGISEVERVSVQILEPLIDMMLKLNTPNIAFKFFLPTTMLNAVWQLLNTRRSDIRLYWLTQWDEDQLERMLSRRLEVFSGNQVTSFQQLCAKDCIKNIDRRLCQAANGSPQRLIELVDGLIAEHCRNIDDPNTRIPQHLIDDFLEREYNKKKQA